jgi:hypothetical protein
MIKIKILTYGDTYGDFAICFQGKQLLTPKALLYMVGPPRLELGTCRL